MSGTPATVTNGMSNHSVAGGATAAPSPSVSPAGPAAANSTSAAATPSANNVALTPMQLEQRKEDESMIAKEAKLTDEQKAKREELRAQVIGEIQSTEKSYVQSLDALTDAFVRPLKERLTSNKHFNDINSSQGEHLTANLETLANFHHTFIDSLIQVQPASNSAAAAAASTNDTTAPIAEAAAHSIPSVFLRYSNFFKLYIPYLNNYESALNTFNALRSHKRFQEWLNGEVKTALNAHATKNGSSQLDLLSYMIQPIQRVPRYVLLLRELKRQTSPYHPEFAALNDALLKVQHVASVINEGQRAVENANKLLQLQNKIVGEFDSLIQPHRRLIREGLVTATYTHGLFSTIRTRKSMFFLFSDALLWTSEAYKFKGLIDLTPAKLTPKSSTSFVIDTANRMLQAAWDSEEETKSWFEAIDEVVCALQNERDKLRQRARVQKARNLGGTKNKDAVHQLVTQSLKGLAEGGSVGPSAADSLSAPANSDSGSSGAHASVGIKAGAGGPPAGSGGTVVGTLGQRSGRKWEETLEAGEAKLRKEQEHLAAFSREKLAADTFSNPEGEAGDNTTANDFPSSSASPPAVPNHSTSTNPTAPQVGGDKKYVARFVSRRGRGTITGGCLCTTILVHKDCPQHGESVQANASLLQSETNENQ